ncbi:uncharacterized protein [Watersipora subatra]|uniref:uncharacterized protein isoform X2 n=1 Tax=Watersipora subatra TaxID=2589382 RepID=UPI00355BDC64
MSGLGFVCILLAVSQISCLDVEREDDKLIEALALRDSKLHFKQWQVKHGRFYSSAEETVRRFATFRTNIDLIQQLNEEYDGITEFEANKFADWSPEEFQAKVLMRKRGSPQHSLDKYLQAKVLDDPLPQTFDWRDKDMVTPVKDQGAAGTCWAFSTVANVEGQYAMKYQKLVNLSVEQVVDCDDSEDVPKSYGDCGVYGGWPYLAFGYLIRQGGIESWEDYGYCCGGGKTPCFVCPMGVWNSSLCGPPEPYCNMSQSCPAKLDKSKFVKGINITGWSALPLNETVIAQQLQKIGPLSVALDATMLQFYSKGVFNPVICSKTKLNHAVLLVGFGTAKGIFGDTPYWTIKNSWGPTWGENGYFRIKRDAGTCGVNTQVTTAILA